MPPARGPSDLWNGTALSFSDTRPVCVKSSFQRVGKCPPREKRSPPGTVRDSALALQILPECKPQIRLVAKMRLEFLRWKKGSGGGVRQGGRSIVLPSRLLPAPLLLPSLLAWIFLQQFRARGLHRAVYKSELAAFRKLALSFVHHPVNSVQEPCSIQGRISIRNKEATPALSFQESAEDKKGGTKSVRRLPVRSLSLSPWRKKQMKRDGRWCRQRRKNWGLEGTAAAALITTEHLQSHCLDLGICPCGSSSPIPALKSGDRSLPTLTGVVSLSESIPLGLLLPPFSSHPLILSHCSSPQYHLWDVSLSLLAAQFWMFAE